MKVISYNGIDTNTCTHPNKEIAYQCYSIGTQCYYQIEANVKPSVASIMLTLQSWKITKANFYTSQL
jgi:hypothetical protein